MEIRGRVPFRPNFDAPWLRWFDKTGTLLPMSEELTVQEHLRAEDAIRRAEKERERAEEERKRAEQESRRVERLAAKLRELGVDPSAI
jgi:hypothetical protein